MICPKCKSKDVSNDMGSNTLFGMNQGYICNKCGFTGSFFIEIDEEEIK